MDINFDYINLRICHFLIKMKNKLLLESLKGSVVNRTYYSMNGRSLEIILK